MDTIATSYRRKLLMRRIFFLISVMLSMLVATLDATALPVTGPTAAVDTTPGVAKFFISGSPVFRAAIEAELSSATSSVCQSGTFNRYSAVVTSGTAPDLVAYSCTSATGLLGSAKPLIIYYRAEGGSIYGVVPLLVSSSYRPVVPQPLRLALTASCGTSTCAVGDSYDPIGDTLSNPTSNAVVDSPDLGVSDLEPKIFATLSNTPTLTDSTKLQPSLSVSETTALMQRSQPLALQSYGIFTHLTSGANGADAEFNQLASLSRRVLAEIFMGTWGDWNQVPKNDGSNTTVTSTSLPIVVCRSGAGSGTQAAAALYFHHTSCTGGTDAFVSNDYNGSSGNIDPMNIIKSTSPLAMRSCISGNPGAIGFMPVEPDAVGRRMIKIDLQGPPTTANNLGIATASGDYTFAFEPSVIKRYGIAGDSATLADKFILLIRDQATGPTSGNVNFLPGPNATHAGFPLDTTSRPGKQPVSCFSRSGNSCNDLVDAGC